MLKKTYYRALLAVPILLPLFGWLLGHAGVSIGILQFLVWSMIIGGAPFILTLIILIVVSFKVSPERFVCWCHFSPFLLVLMFGVCSLGFAIFNGFKSDWDMSLISSFFSVWLIGALYSFSLGYLYILLASVLYMVIKKVGLIEIEPEKSWHDV